MEDDSPARKAKKPRTKRRRQPSRQSTHHFAAAAGAGLGELFTALLRGAHLHQSASQRGQSHDSLSSAQLVGAQTSNRSNSRERRDGTVYLRALPDGDEHARGDLDPAEDEQEGADICCWDKGKRE
jgi:hypothetical protein